MKRIPYLLGLMAMLLLSALPSFAQDAKLLEVLAGKTAPLTLKLGQLDGTWRCISPTPPKNGADTFLSLIVSSQMHQPLPMNVMYTKGETVTAAGEVYLLAYNYSPQAMASPEQMQRGEAPKMVPMTADSEITLCLLNIRTMGSLLDIHPFDLKQEIAAGPNAMALQGAERKAKEASLKGNLHELRNALEQFQADTGAYPLALTDLLRDEAHQPTAGVDLEGKRVTITRGSYKGPYLTTQGGLPSAPGIPLNPFVDMNAAQPDPNNVATHWKYQNGLLHCPDWMKGNTLDNIPYNGL